MTHAQSHSQSHWAETVYDTRPSDSSFDIDPSERISAPAPHYPRSWIAFRFAIAVALTGAWIGAASTLDLARVVSGAQPALATVLAKARALSAHVRAPEAQPAAAGSPYETAMAPLPGEDSETTPLFAAVPIQEDLSVSDARSETVGTEYTESSEAAEESPDKKQKRTQAAAAGLGPDLPNVLLSRLSKEDFKNAAYAIKTALAKTGGDAKFVWPSAPSRQQAVFEVRFVTGAAPGCRRYVVTVTKDRWSSTSAALERCGATMARAS